MRIGLRVSPRASGGGKAFLENLVRELNAHPACSEVTVFSMGREPESFDLPHVIRVPVAGGALRRRLSGSSALAAAVAASPVDILVAPGNEVTPVAGTPTLMWPLTVAPFEATATRELGTTVAARMRWALLRRAIGSAARQADGFVFSSHYAMSLYRSALPRVREVPTRVIPPAATVIPGTVEAPPAVPAPYLLFVSHLYPYKMVVETVEGYAKARLAGLQHHLVIAGNPVDKAYERRIKDSVARLGLGEYVHLLGGVPQSQLPALYEGADLFIFPSLSENAGSFAVIDAFHFGVPVLAGCLSSVPEACQDGARYFDPRSPDHLALELTRLMSAPELLRDLARRSRDRGAEYHGWSDIAADLIGLCEDLVRGVRSPPA